MIKTIHSENQIKVSIIVPVYNVEKYVEECLKSIIHQTYRNIEIICINDGSVDGSVSVLKKYESLDSRLTVIHQENRGLSASRNTGIQLATGKYLLFVDSDDYIEQKAVEICVREMESSQLDILCFDAWAFENDEQFQERAHELQHFYKRNKNYEGIYTGKELFDEMRKNSDYKVAVWGYCYRTDMIRHHQIFFVNGIYHEDHSFTFESLQTSKKASYTSNILYCRRVREGSITTVDRSFKHSYGLFAGAIEMINWLSNSQFDKNYTLEIDKWIIETMIKTSRGIYSNLNSSEKAAYLDLPINQMLLFYNLIVHNENKDIIHNQAIENLNSELRKADETIDQLKTKRSDLIGDIKRYQEKVSLMSEEIKELKCSKVELNNQLNCKETEKIKLRNSQLNEQLERIGKRVYNLEKEKEQILNDYQIEREDLNQRIATLNRNNEMLQKELMEIKQSHFFQYYSYYKKLRRKK